MPGSVRVIETNARATVYDYLFIYPKLLIARVDFSGVQAASHITGTPVWIHCDLLRPNLLVRDGRLSAVIDFGGIGAGDPATDVSPAWAVFDAPGRAAFRDALGVDDDTWARARGIALHQAALIVPYYAKTNPGFSALARRTIAQVLEDH